MDIEHVPSVLVGAICLVVFVAAFLAGDIAGLLIEAKMAESWRKVAGSMGFEFDGVKRKCPSLSGFILPKLLLPGTTESAFVYGQVLKSMKGKVEEFEVRITDFTIWNFFTRGPLVFRAVVCVLKADPVFPCPVAVVKGSSSFLQGFASSSDLRACQFSRDAAFGRIYAGFTGELGSPWVITPEMRRLCVEHHQEIDCFFTVNRQLILISTEDNPRRFPHLAQTVVHLASCLLEGLPRTESRA
ncbi:MAG TPA: hypothetical protein VK463_16135 [Desulfomonilaceae bacterium]|nr:hypothetical protein [Desulfomonilaceae bacterium]